MIIYKSYGLSVILLTVLFLCPSLLQAQARFVELDDLPGGEYESYAMGVSGDGKVVVGSSISDSSEEAVKWVFDPGTNKYVLSSLGRVAGQFSGLARSVSYDGKYITGSISGSNGTTSFKFTSGSGYNFFVPQPENGIITNNAFGISSDGSTIVGEIMSDSGRMKPFKYTAANGVEILEIPADFHTGYARSVSADGSVIVGSVHSNFSFYSDPFQVLSWSHGGMLELSRANVFASVNGLSQDGKIAVGNVTIDSDTRAIRWSTDGNSSGYLPYPCQVPYAVSGDGSVIVGWTYYDGVFGGNKAFVWDNSNGLRNIQEILVNDYKLNLIGWRLTNATGVSADGTVIVGIGINPDGKTAGWLAYIPYISLEGPYSGQTLLAEDIDTLRWTYGGIEVNKVNIYLSLDSGKTRKPIVSDYQASKKEYVWNIQDTMARECQLFIVAVNDPSLESESEIFEIKAYRMHRFKPYPDSDTKEYFDPAIHGWTFANTDGNMWPASWWSSFNYLTGIDPYSKQYYPKQDPFLYAKPSDYIDWPLFVRTFGEANCYWLLPVIGNAGNYDGSAVNVWKTHKSSWGGSCYGFAYSTLMAFYDPDRLRLSFPEMPEFNDPVYAKRYILSTLIPDDQIRKVINSVMFTQFGKAQDDYYGNKLKTTRPNQTLEELRFILLYPYNGQGLSLVPDNDKGGHEVVPYRITKDPASSHRFRVYVNDSNIPASYNTFIIVDTLNNSWTYDKIKNKKGVSWFGFHGLTLDMLCSNYFSIPTLPKAGSPFDKKRNFYGFQEYI